MKIQKFLRFVVLFFILLGLYACPLVDIEGNLLKKLQKFQYVSVDFNADIKSNNSVISFSSLSVDNSPPWGSVQKFPLEWNGPEFSTDFDYQWELFSGEKVQTYGQIWGTMSDDGTIVETLTADVTSFYPGEGDVFKYFISLIDVPYFPDYEYDEYTPRFQLTGPSVSSSIYSYSQSWDFTDSSGNKVSIYSTSVNYNNPDDDPYIYVTFSGEK